MLGKAALAKVPGFSFGSPGLGPGEGAYAEEVL